MPTRKKVTGARMAFQSPVGTVVEGEAEAAVEGEKSPPTYMRIPAS